MFFLNFHLSIFVYELFQCPQRVVIISFITPRGQHRQKSTHHK